MKKSVKLILVCGLASLLSAAPITALGMDRLAALSMIESGDNDATVGRAGEVSRFQIKPELWEKFCRQSPAAARTNPQAARSAARAIIDTRCRDFKRQFHRSPTDFEFYVLWNAPAEIRKPSPVVTRRANRFCNLVGS